jgi:hypothetical protein
VLDYLATSNETPTTRGGVPLWKKPWLTFPEAMRLTRKGRLAVQEMLDSGRWISVPEGKRVKIATKSIIDDVETQIAAVRAAMDQDKAA